MKNENSKSRPRGALDENNMKVVAIDHGLCLRGKQNSGRYPLTRKDAVTIGPLRVI